jgi:4'-phosphopantetheinyl transferase
VPYSPAAALTHGDVLVRWQSTDELTADAARTALARLSVDECARHDRFRFDCDRRDFAAAHALLRETLSDVTGLPPEAWRFDTNAHGKPNLVSGLSPLPLSFNLSHTRGFVACAVALDADVGLDVEQVSREINWRTIARRCCASSELASIDHLTDPASQTARFIELWTLKEAWSKALGVGMARVLGTQSFAAAFDVTDPSAIRCTLPDAVNPAVWRFALASPVPSVRIALAVSDGTKRPWHIDMREGRPESRPRRELIAAAG